MQRKASRPPSGAASSRAGTISVIIETPRGSRNKLKYEPSKRMYKLSKVMPEGMVFPYDFGFVPETRAADGDPLDVLVLTDEPLFTGCLAQKKEVIEPMGCRKDPSQHSLSGDSLTRATAKATGLVRRPTS